MNGVERFSLGALAAQPWKNGGGITREIAAWPPGAGMDAFLWRVSVADIAADGPFSAFPGIDRQIVLLEGAGVRLQADNGSFDHRLDTVGEPFAFAGERGVQATLLDGTTRDFNVMTRRGRCRASVVAARDEFTIAPGAHVVLLLVVEGAWRHGVAGQSGQAVLASDDGMLFAEGVAVPYRLQAMSEPALCLCVTLELELENP
ncbi:MULTISPECIES: HutD family protein [unclassified Cupriavidus]|uniref:HutD/Ves family protein n=1 Tax=unclassified Cupriavidus TaxID=2640874 RepID=UPI00227180AE|nr:HutD family protein [Cupriavidus sp. D39]MCY0856467.1 HutD family protein [Cupriavidus sp. D39]